MSTFERDGYQWRETYFVFFESKRRPTLKQIEKAIGKVSKKFVLDGAAADDAGNFESLTILSESDYAAVDLAFEMGDEVREQAQAIAKEFKPHADMEEKKQFDRIAKCDAKLDLLHFENMAAANEAGLDDDDEDDMLDPSALLLMLDAMTDLTGGVGIDPAAGLLP